VDRSPESVRHHSRAYTSSEQQASREFESYKISAYSKGDAAWIVGDWQGAEAEVLRRLRDHSPAQPRTGKGRNRRRQRQRLPGASARGDSERRRQHPVDDVAGPIEAETAAAPSIWHRRSEVNVRTGGGTSRSPLPKASSARRVVEQHSNVVSCQQGASLDTGAATSVERSGHVRPPPAVAVWTSATSASCRNRDRWRQHPPGVRQDGR